MLALPELQSRFYDGLVFGAEAEDGLIDCLVESGDEGRRRIAAYRRSVFGNLVGALAATYPVVSKIVGLAFFREMARAYVRAHPSSSGDLNEYGGEFAGFVASWPHARGLGYLSDVARLEWRVQKVYYASEAVVDLSALASCAPEKYGVLRFGVAPAAARLDSPWPLADIWRVNADGYAGDMAVDFSQGARLLVLRREGLVHVETLAEGEAAFLDALANGDCLEAAVSSAVAADGVFDLTAVLGRFVATGILVRAWSGALP